MSSTSSPGPKRQTRLETAALVAALIPTVAAVVRACLTDWMPVGDAAYFTARSRDVLTSHHPWVGAWSSGSVIAGVDVNTLGPLLFDVLAPFTKVSPYLGTAVGAAVVNAVSVVLVWLVARRLFRPVVVVVVMAGTLLLMSTLGLSWLIDVRQQFVLVLPLFALLWLSVGMWAGIGWSVPAAVGVASLCAQTHFSYVYQAVLVTLAGAVGFVMVVWRSSAGRALVRRVGLWSGLVAAVCWVQPVIDQFFVSGNLGTALGPARDSAGAGLDTGVAVMADGGLMPPFWFPGSIGSFLGPGDGVPTGTSIAVTRLWLVAAALLCWAGRRRRLSVVQAAGVAAVVALLAAMAAVVQIPLTVFGLAPQNYYWLWAVSAFATLALLAAVLSLPPVVAELRRPPLALRRALPLIVLAGLLFAAVWPRYPISGVKDLEAEAQRVGLPLRQQLRPVLRSWVVDRTVEFATSEALLTQYRYVVLIEMQRAGIDVYFPAASRNLARFGQSRCVATGRHQRVMMLVGPDPVLPPDATVIANVVGISNADIDELERLRVYFRDRIRDGRLSVNLSAVTYFGFDTSDVSAVIDDPRAPLDGVARDLATWDRLGMVEVPASDRDNFESWVALERRMLWDHLTVIVRPPSPGGGGEC